MTLWKVTPETIFRACQAPTLLHLMAGALQTPDPELALRGRLAEYATVVLALIENLDAEFHSAERAGVALFQKHAGGGAGNGVPGSIVEAVLDALIVSENEPVTFDGVAGAVKYALERVAQDSAGRSRLAFASTLGHAESIWVQEVAFQLTKVGVPPSMITRESSVGSQRMVDLAVGQTPIEFKSTFASFALNHTAAHTAQWLGKDIEKIRSAGHDGLYVVTVAHLTDIAHKKIKFSSRYSAGLSSEDVIVQGLKRYSDYLSNETASVPVHVDLGDVLVSDSGMVHLDALIVHVRQ
jgi:hypothetical protein